MIIWYVEGDVLVEHLGLQLSIVSVRFHEASSVVYFHVKVFMKMKKCSEFLTQTISGVQVMSVVSSSHFYED